ncbi:MAG: alpha-glucan family phosphorylase [Candidatus Omnitrophica bacterium]|nr:alpha-glucan family phosphorylase [Candidatus Omnitrophota bacterium]
MNNIDRTLRNIASNLMFEWNADVHLLFRGVSPYVWGLFRRNIYRFLRLQSENPSLYHHRLAEILTDSSFLRHFQKVEKYYHDYMNPESTVVSQKYTELAGKTIAYFSMEYGIDILRIYSGGLGILSGDHLRGASDLGLNMVGVGLFYLLGYYEQCLGLDGEMKVDYEPVYPPNKPIRDFLPLEPVKRAGSSDDLIVKVQMNNHQVKARVWRVRIGRCELLLLDTNLKENGIHDRHITRRLYASEKQYDMERRRRIEQEMLLGIGGVQALREAGYKPAVYHLNEGHVAFAALEVIRRLIEEESLSFQEAWKQAGKIIGFTTHTPVPEGNERFDERLAREYLQPYLDQFLRHDERETIFNCARNHEDSFDMTKLALLMSGVFRNGVSALHGEVCRKMWGYVWGVYDGSGKNVPIGHVTNAVHVPYWQKPVLRYLIDSYGGLEHVQDIPDEKIWSLHLEFKIKLIEKIRERVAYQLLREGCDSQEIHDRTLAVLTADSFMIGFARRFAFYKRTTMLIDDESRFLSFVEHAYRKYGKPVYVLFAGKPHPNNYEGYEKIKKIVSVAERLEQRAREKNFIAQLVFIEGYDIDLARYLEAGVDIWLNNPIRPQEASGTSGMKAGMNGVLNVSISDGWVPEGIRHGKNGWIFGSGQLENTDNDRNALYTLLERTILPLYFERTGRLDELTPVSQELSSKFEFGISGPIYFSRGWVAMMKESIRTLTQYFNTDRMLQEYIEKMYLPAVKSSSVRAGR